jgi:outer membrane protein OmpA-like peptidoglycan-associated protein
VSFLESVPRTVIRIAVGAAVLVLLVVLTAVWIKSAEARLNQVSSSSAAEPAPVAAVSDATYCSPGLKRILRRVLTSCGLAGNGSSRGCQPIQAKNVATMSGADFNALFQPMRDRGGIVQFELGKSDLDSNALALIDQVFADQKGASWFFVVARSSPDGSVDFNRTLSKARAEAVMNHLRDRFKDPDLDKEVGMLWLGKEYAQLDTEFCQWKRSATGSTCTSDDINRSAFIAWIDCQL